MDVVIGHCIEHPRQSYCTLERNLSTDLIGMCIFFNNKKIEETQRHQRWTAQSWQSKGLMFSGTLKFILIDWMAVCLFIFARISWNSVSQRSLFSWVFKNDNTFQPFYERKKTDFLFTFDAVCSFAWVNCQYVTITKLQKMEWWFWAQHLFVRLSHGINVRFWSRQCVESGLIRFSSSAIHFSLSVRHCGFQHSLIRFSFLLLLLILFIAAFAVFSSLFRCFNDVPDVWPHYACMCI